MHVQLRDDWLIGFAVVIAVLAVPQIILWLSNQPTKRLQKIIGISLMLIALAMLGILAYLGFSAIFGLISIPKGVTGEAIAASTIGSIFIACCMLAAGIGLTLSE